jgi:hypothetical protein
MGKKWGKPINLESCSCKCVTHHLVLLLSEDHLGSLGTHQQVGQCVGPAHAPVFSFPSLFANQAEFPFMLGQHVSWQAAPHQFGGGRESLDRNWGANPSRPTREIRAHHITSFKERALGLIIFHPKNSNAFFVQ